MGRAGTGRGIDPRLVDGRRRIALPKQVLRALGVGPGDYVAFQVTDADVRMVKVALTLLGPRT